MYEEKNSWGLAEAYLVEKAVRKHGALTRSSYSADLCANTEKVAL